MTLLERLAEIEERLKAATPSPWDYPARHGDCYVAFAEIVDENIKQSVTHRQNDIAPCAPNLELIAHAPSDLAFLVAALKVATRALDASCHCETSECDACVAQAEIERLAQKGGPDER